MFSKNKKAYWFPIVGAILSLGVLLPMFWLVVINPAGEAFFDKDFGILKNVDLKNNVQRNEKVMIETYTTLFLLDSKNDFLKNLIQEKGILDFFFGDDEDEFEGCIYEEKLIFYNEKNLKDDDDDTTDCLIGFGDSFDDEFYNYIQLTLEKNLAEGLDDSHTTLDWVKIDKEDSSNDFSISLQTTFTAEDKKGQNGKVESRNVYTIDSNLGLYEDLMVALENNLPLLSNAVQTRILSCKARGEYLVEDVNEKCTLEILQDLIETSNSQLVGKYNYELEHIENDEVEGFLGYNLKITNIATNTLDVDIIIVIEDSIPYDVVDFSVSNFEGLDNVIDVDIAELGGSIKPTNYIVMYSYENFLDRNQYGATRYDKLISMLENSEIPDEFVNSQENYYYSDELEGLDLNLILVDPNSNFDEGKRTVKIYQINNIDTGEYELLESGRQVYISVFAVDSSFNYFTDEVLLAQASKSISPKAQLGPSPITETHLSVTTTLQSLDESFAFEIDSYDDPKANNFMIYITKDRDGDSLTDRCEGVDYPCIFAPLNYVLGERKSYLVSSDSSSSLEGHDLIFVDAMEFEFDSTYEFIIATYDSSGTVVLDSISKDLTIKERETPNGNFFEIDNEGLRLIRPTYSEVKIEDNKPPVSSDITITSMVLNGNDVFLDWTRPSGSDVTEILVSGKAYTSELEFNSVGPARLKPEDFLIPVTIGDYQRVEIDKITMFDAAGNSGIYSSTISWP